MRTTSNLPKKEIEKVICVKRCKRLLGMAGKVKFVEGYDVRSLRTDEVKQRKQQLGLD